MVFPDAVRENQKGVAETLLCLSIAFDVDTLLLRAGHLDQDAVLVLLHLRFTLFERAAGRGTGPVVVIRVALVLSAGVPHPGLDLERRDVERRCVVKAALFRQGKVAFGEVAHVSPPPVR